MDQDLRVEILLAALALAAGVGAAVVAAGAAVVAARTSKRASDFVARSDRFAEWQMYKRQTYGNLLASVRSAQVDPTSKQLLEVASAFDAAQLAAGDRLGGILCNARVQVESGSGSGAVDSSLRQLIGEMRKDIADAREGSRTSLRHRLRLPGKEDEYHGEE